MEANDIVNNHQLEETSSKTRFVKHSFSHRWAIENFSEMLADTSSEYPMFKSAPFSSPVNSAIQFNIDLQPKGNVEDSKDYLSVFLRLASSPENAVLANYTICLVDSNGMERQRHEGNKPDIYSSEHTSWGWKKSWLRSEVLDTANGLLNDDRLTILCEVTVFDGSITFSLDTGKYMPSIEEVKVLSKKQILVDLTSLLECDKQTDVTVVVGNGAKEIRAHKFVLVGASSVFEAMFKFDTTVDVVSDVSVEVGELFIQYLYTGKVNQLETYAKELLVVADMYDTDLLKRMCVQCLCSQISTESVCQLLLLSDRHSSTKLQLACIEYITNHATEVILTEDWQMMSQLNDTLKVDLFCKLANKHPTE